MVFNVHLIAMAGGNDLREASNNFDLEVNNDEGTNASFADAGNDPNSSNPIQNNSSSSSKEIYQIGIKYKSIKAKPNKLLTKFQLT